MEKKTLIDIIKESYLYGYPIVGMYELMYNQVINKETKVTGFNEFFHTTDLVNAKNKSINALSNDTIYSKAWLDLRKNPVIIKVPNTKGRYYTIQLLDFFTETIDNIGKRIYGTKEESFLVVGPSWSGKVPKGIKYVIKSNTNFVLAFLRVLVNGEEDLEEAINLQKKFQLNRLYIWKYNNIKLKETHLNSFPICKTETSLDFFKTLNNIFQMIPLLKVKKNLDEAFETLGIQSYLEKKILESVDINILDKGVSLAKEKLKEEGFYFGKSINNWRIASRGIGVYGVDYFQRALVWFKGALANVPEEVIYPSVLQDMNGEFLNGKNNYVIHFEKDQLPKVNQFWSLRMHVFETGSLFDNNLNRYSIEENTKGIIFGKDGSLTIYIQNRRPDKEKESNWLPAPKGLFYMSLRIYGPSKSTINGEWYPPYVQKVYNNSDKNLYNIPLTYGVK